MLKQLLESSRRIIIVPVIGSLIGAIACLVYGGLVVLRVLADFLVHPQLNEEGVKLVAVGFIQVIDLFLLGTVLYIIAMGLYELFISDELTLPPWLEIHDLDELKARLVGVIVVALVVSFFAKVVEWQKGIDILYLGGAIAIVVAAISLLPLPVLAPKRRREDRRD
jgi:uncharacterized membrane protein YqhA